MIEYSTITGILTTAGLKFSRFFIPRFNRGIRDVQEIRSNRLPRSSRGMTRGAVETREFDSKLK